MDRTHLDWPFFADGHRALARGQGVERLHRDIRAPRIHEAATDVQRLIVGRTAIAEAKETEA